MSGACLWLEGRLIDEQETFLGIQENLVDLMAQTEYGQH